MIVPNNQRMLINQLNHGHSNSHDLVDHPFYKMEQKMTSFEERLTDLELLNDSKCQNDCQQLKILIADNDKRIRELLKVQEDKMKNHLSYKINNDDLNELLKLRASKVDLGELNKKCIQIYNSLEPIIVNQDLFKRLCHKLETQE